MFRTARRLAAIAALALPVMTGLAHAAPVTATITFSPTGLPTRPAR